MSFVTVYDQFSQAWKVTENDPLYPEALQEASKGDKIYWPLKKIVESRGWGWWAIFKHLDELEADLEKQMPNPGKVRLIELDKEYLPTELRDLLQRFGSYLANLYHIEAMVEAQGHALREGFKTGLTVAIAQSGSTANTVTAKEAEVLANNELLRDTRKMQIDHEATLILIKGWRTSYEQAHQTVSRLITLAIGEVQLQTNRTP